MHGHWLLEKLASPRRDHNGQDPESARETHTLGKSFQEVSHRRHVGTRGAVWY